MDSWLRPWCLAHLGAAPREVFFQANSMSSVSGLCLADGRRVAVKRRAASDRVLACAQAHRVAQAAGIDAPELLAGPIEVEPGVWVSAEEWREEGSASVPADPGAYPRLLRALVLALQGLDPARFAPPPPWAHYDHGAPGRTFAPPVSARWDPESPTVPAELRRLAAAAGARLRAEALSPVVGHSDLNGLNVRWSAAPIVHDWDSLAGRPEAVLAGILAVNHVEGPGAGAITDLVGTETALEHYQQLRPFSPVEVELAWAAGVWVAAYNAAFEYLHGAPGLVARQLQQDGAERLRLAGCGDLAG